MQVIELSHPLKSHYLTILRNENTNSEEFRSYATKLSYLLFIEGTKNISLKESAEQLGYLESNEFDNLVDPSKMIGPSKK